MKVGLKGESSSAGDSLQHLAVGRRRSNIEIIADMLRVGENGAGKTEIMYSANMSYSQIQKYLEYLVGQGFICRVKLEDTLVAYQITESGLKLLNAIDSLMAMLSPEKIQDIA